MPIKPELRHFYGREWREVTRPRILARAGNCCEQCSVPNAADVTRVGGFWFIPVDGAAQMRLRDGHGRPVHISNLPDLPARHVRIVLTIAHLNHVSGDDRDENLKALCQWCHLHYDQQHHHETRATRKDAARPLLAEAI